MEIFLPFGFDLVIIVKIERFDEMKLWKKNFMMRMGLYGERRKENTE